MPKDTADNTATEIFEFLRIIWTSPLNQMALIGVTDWVVFVFVSYKTRYTVFRNKHLTRGTLTSFRFKLFVMGSQKFKK